jgi:DNA-binding transcriptional ArsR family regulator
MLRAAGEPSRLRLLELLSSGERCVSDLVAVTGDPMPAVSQRLGRLKAEGLVVSRRAGKHIHYALADGHVASLLLAVLEHADHASATSPSPGTAP